MTDSMIRDFWVNRRLTGGVLEKRTLEPICTTLLSHSYKNALQATQKALKAKPEQPVVQLLQAVAFHHLGEGEMALGIASQVAKQTAAGKGLTDGDSMNLCTWVLEQNNEVNSGHLWDAVLKARPADVALWSHALYYYIGKAEWGAVQSVADHLHRNLLPRAPTFLKYQPELESQALWFYIMAILLRIQYSGKLTLPQMAQEGRIRPYDVKPGNEASVLDEAAKRMRAKPEEDLSKGNLCKVPSHYYLMLKTLLWRYQRSTADDPSRDEYRSELLDVLATEDVKNICEKELALELLRRECEQAAYSQPHQWQSVMARLAKLLKEGDTNWSTLSCFVHAVYAYARTSKESASEEAADLDRASTAWWTAASSIGTDALDWPESKTGDEALANAKALLSALAGGDDNVEPSKKDRGYTLGLLELATFDEASAAELPVADLVILYFQRFGSKACCFDDLLKYITPLAQTSSPSLRKITDFFDVNYPVQNVDVSTMDKMNYSLTAEKLRRALAPVPSSAEAELEEAHRFIKAYFDSLHYGDGLAATELQPADEWAFLAGQAFVQAYSISQSIAHLELAAAILEFAIRRSKYRYHIRVLLIRIYRLLGASSLVLHHHTLLDARNIQQDTVSHFALERASTFCTNRFESQIYKTQEDPPRSIADVISRTALWYKQANTELKRSVMKAWSDEAYTIIESYAELDYKVANSLTCASMAVENLRAVSLRGPLDAAQDEGNLPEHMGLLSFTGKLEDNRDDSILVNLQPLSLGSANIATQTAMGPKTGDSWARRMICSWLMIIWTGLEDPSLPDLKQDEVCAARAHGDDQLTKTERRYESWADRMADWLAGRKDSIEEGTVIDLFKASQEDLKNITTAMPLWQGLHVAAVALEAFALFDTAFQFKNQREAQFKHIKQFRQLRQDAKACLKGTSTRLKVMVDELSREYKGKNRINNLQPLTRYEKMDEAWLMEFAGGLLESRKNALGQLATTITKRIAGN